MIVPGLSGTQEAKRLLSSQTGEIGLGAKSPDTPKADPSGRVSATDSPVLRAASLLSKDICLLRVKPVNRSSTTVVFIAAVPRIVKISNTTSDIIKTIPLSRVFFMSRYSVA